MSNLAGAGYPVVEDSRAGDLYTVVRGGELKKQTRQAMTDYAKGEALKTARNGGLTFNRPETPALFEFYFDTTLGKPVWYNGAFWVDATGAAV